jgi:hypothetical protein
MGWRIRDYRNGRKVVKASFFAAALGGAAAGAVATGAALRGRRN